MSRGDFRNLVSFLLGLWPSAVLFGFFYWLLCRMLWAWGHWRLAATVRNQGRGCVCHWNCEIKYPERIRLGDKVVIGVNVVLGGAGGISLGDNVRISREAILETAGLDFRGGRPPYEHVARPIVVEDGAWIGSRAIILGGVTIGQDAVVAAGAVVTKDVPPRSVASGIPAKVRPAKDPST